MKTYIVEAPYSVEIKEDRMDLPYANFNVDYVNKHFFKCDLDLADLKGSLDKIQSRCMKMSRNYNGCRINFDLGRGSNMSSHSYQIHTPTDKCLKHFYPGDPIDTTFYEDNDDNEIVETVVLSAYDSQATVRSKIEQTIYLREDDSKTGKWFGEEIAKYECLLDKDGNFIKEVA